MKKLGHRGGLRATMPVRRLRSTSTPQAQPPPQKLILQPRIVITTQMEDFFRRNSIKIGWHGTERPIHQAVHHGSTATRAHPIGPCSKPHLRAATSSRQGSRTRAGWCAERTTLAISGRYRSRIASMERAMAATQINGSSSGRWIAPPGAFTCRRIPSGACSRMQSRSSRLHTTSACKDVTRPHRVQSNGSTRTKLSRTEPTINGKRCAKAQCSMARWQ